MISEQQVIIKNLALSIKGELQLSSTDTMLVFPHQCLHLQASKIATKPIGTQTLSYHRKFPLSLQNTSITPTLIDHQIHTLLNNNSKQSQVLIVDSSPSNGTQKTAEVFKKYHVIRGYNYQLPASLLTPAIEQLSKQTQVLISTEHIKKDVEYVFAVISEQQPGFIGQIDLPDHFQKIKSASPFYKGALSNLFKSYQQFSTQTQCPIYINLLPHGSQGYFSSFSNVGSQFTNFTTLVQYLLKQLLTHQQCYKNIVLLNPHILIKTQIDNKTIKHINQHQDLITKLYSHGFSVCFDLSRYQNQQSLAWIAQYIKYFSSKTIISPGLKFKTDFIQFGGEGLQLQHSLQQIQRILQKQEFVKLIKIVTKENIIRLLSWYEKKIIKIKVKMWKCLKCAKEFPETVEAFRKFGKDFCSIDCVRSYKF